MLTEENEKKLTVGLAKWVGNRCKPVHDHDRTYSHSKIIALITKMGHPMQHRVGRCTKTTPDGLLTGNPEKNPIYMVFWHGSGITPMGL